MKYKELKSNFKNIYKDVIKFSLREDINNINYIKICNYDNYCIITIIYE